MNILRNNSATLIIDFNKEKESKQQKKIAVFSFFISLNGYTAHPVVRSIKEVLKYFDYTYIGLTIDISEEDKEFVEYIMKKCDIVIQLSDSFYYPSKFVKSLIEKYNKKFFYYCFDYTWRPHYSWRNFIKENAIVISNVEKIKSFKPKNIYALNLNSLVFDERNLKNPFTKPFEIIYYGSYRENRIKYFKKYLKHPVILSTHRRNIKKFKEISSCDIIDVIDWNNPILKYFKYSLYIEDLYTHRNYNHLSSRFYEALNCYAVPVFDESCKNTIKQSGYEIEDRYIISDINQIKNLTYNEDYINFLRKEAKKEKKQITKQLIKILS